MDWFSDHGFDTWTMDNEGYGRSDKHRNINFDISNGADDLAVGSQYILDKTGATSLLMYGISSGALKAALFTERHPERVAKLALDAFVWTGEGSHTLEQRKKKLPEFLAQNRRPIDRDFVHSIFKRDHPLPIGYKGHRVDSAVRVDFLIEDSVIVSTGQLDLGEATKQHMKNVLRLTGVETGLLVNFNVDNLRDGVKRIIVSELPPALHYQS